MELLSQSMSIGEISEINFAQITQISTDNIPMKKVPE